MRKCTLQHCFKLALKGCQCVDKRVSTSSERKRGVCVASVLWLGDAAVMIGIGVGFNRRCAPTLQADVVADVPDRST